MKKIIQLTASNENVYCLTDDGAAYVLINWIECQRTKWQKLPAIPGGPTCTAAESATLNMRMSQLNAGVVEKSKK